MFHIKTDIRQYKCESQEKVERLIRNWVIRPSDLVYNSDDKSWSPIGQHPVFNDIFAAIEQAEASESVDIAEADVQASEETRRERTETPARSLRSLDFVSEGYKLPLPVDISPSPQDIRLGLKHSRVDRKKKDAVFPYPKPKKPGQVTVRRFELDPEEPRDQSLLLVVVAVLCFTVVLLGAITMLG